MIWGVCFDHLIFETAEPGAHQFSWASWAVSSGTPPTNPRLQTCTTTTASPAVGAGDPNMLMLAH